MREIPLTNQFYTVQLLLVNICLMQGIISGINFISGFYNLIKFILDQGSTKIVICINIYLYQIQIIMYFWSYMSKTSQY